MYKLSDLRDRDVINIYDGRRLGVIIDVDVDPDCGRIVSLICPGGGRFFGLFGGGKDYVIPWERVVRIGPDVILVDIKNFQSYATKDNGDRDVTRGDVTRGKWLMRGE